MKNAKTFKFIIKRTHEAINKARLDLVENLKNFSIHEDEISRFELIVYELLINVYEHGSEKYINSYIELFCKYEDNNVLIEIANQDIEFDICKKDLPDIEFHFKSGRDSGLGIFMIKTLMDRVEHRYEHGINITTISRKINNKGI